MCQKIADLDEQEILLKKRIHAMRRRLFDRAIKLRIPDDLYRTLLEEIKKSPVYACLEFGKKFFLDGGDRNKLDDCSVENLSKFALSCLIEARQESVEQKNKAACLLSFAAVSGKTELLRMHNQN